jgi:undecaprenyl-diphosphatase
MYERPKAAPNSEPPSARSRRNVVFPHNAPLPSAAPGSGVVRARSKRVLRFLKRHVWSLSLGGLSAISFLHLASEIQEDELGPFDRAVAGWLQGGRGTWDAPMLALSRFGEFQNLLVVCGLAIVALLLLRRRREGLFLIACGAGAGMGSVLLKLVFHRARPSLTAPYLVALPQSFSFPSGHAMGSMAVVGSLAIVTFALRPPRRWRILAAGLALTVSFGVAASRVYFCVHYPSDVVGGQLAAAAWVAAMTGWFFPRLLRAEAAKGDDLGTAGLGRWR